MPAIAFAIPVVPGQEELDRQTFREMEGTRRQEYEAALRDAGITRHTAWHQQTPDGLFAIVYMEANDAAAVANFASSDAEFNTWFREQMRQVHGIDISEGGPQVEQVHDIQV